MDKLKYEDIKEYLRIKKLQEEDKSEEMIEEIFNEVCKEIDEEKKDIWKKLKVNGNLFTLYLM